MSTIDKSLKDLAAAIELPLLTSPQPGFRTAMEWGTGLNLTSPNMKKRLDAAFAKGLVERKQFRKGDGKIAMYYRAKGKS